MKKSWKNSVTIEGYIFNVNLQERVTGENAKHPGQPFINGSINIATDDQALNIVPVYFTYVIPTYGQATAERPNPKPNPNYDILKGFINGNCTTYETVGTNATKVRIQGEIEINDFFSSRSNEMIAQKRIRGSFVNIISTLNGEEATFEADMLIASIAYKQVEEGDDYLQLNGYCFNFRGDLLPVTFSTTKGIKYFEDANISSENPMLTTVWGNIESNVVKHEIEKESAFGDVEVEVTSRTFRAWDVTGAAKEPMEFNTSETITLDELKKALENRTQYVEQRKQEQMEYQNNRNNGFAGNVTPAAEAPKPVANKGFIF